MPTQLGRSLRVMKATLPILSRRSRKLIPLTNTPSTLLLQRLGRVSPNAGRILEFKQHFLIRRLSAFRLHLRPSFVSDQWMFCMSNLQRRLLALAPLLSAFTIFRLSICLKRLIGGAEL